MRRLGLLFIFLIISSLAFAQQGVISGKVTDKKTGDGVIGATVLVTGTVQAAPVDVQGNYELRLAPGTYNITMTYIGYKPLTFAGIVVTANGKTTLNGVMEENATNLKEVTVTGQKQTGTEVAMIQDLKKSEVVVSGMSNDQIVKTLDRDAAEVVKRIPGVTIQNNNFIVIRGLAERYNTVLLNDALTPSAEVDTRSFSFDILPSSVIDRVLIFKSGSPELPGEFGGGVVKVYTKNSVLDNSTSLSVSGWSRSTNTFDSGYLTSNHSNTDFLGFDNDQRKMPDALSVLKPATPSDATQTEALRGNLRNEFLPRVITSRPDLRLSLGVNRKFEIGQAYVSNVTSISYSNTQEQYTSERQRFDAYIQPGILPDADFSYVDTRSVSAVRLGIIHNYQVRFNDRNRLEFRNFFNQYGTDEVVNRQGLNFENGTGPDAQQRNDYALHYQSRSIYSGQLGGSHDVGATNNTTLTWATGYNYVNREEPDYRQNQQARYNRPGTEDDPNLLKVVIDIVPQTSSRFYSTLNENTYMASGQVERRYRGRDTTSVNQYKVRAGFYAEEKERKYSSRYFNYARSRNFNFALADLPLSTIFNDENINPDGGFVLREGTLPQDRYTGKNRLVAGYLSGVAPISDKFSFSGGVRLEYNRKSLASGDTESETSPEKPYEETRTFWLPSLNATYNFTQRSLLRAGGSVSVNRPEFREVANYTYYDFNTNFFIQGSSDLRTARIYNADLRYEFYPTRAELLSVGVFYKHFTDAIEQVTRSTSNVTLTYQNADKAYDVGVEVEARKSLLDVTDSRFLQRFSFVVNASLIRSRVDLDTTKAENRDFAVTNRPLQGQSPYVVNFGTFYQDDEHHWQISAQYNIIGPRLAFVGDKTQNYSVFDLPRHVVDLAVTKGFKSHLEVRAGVQNLLNQQVRQYYDIDRNGKINGFEKDAVFARYRRGVYSTLGLTYRF
ncbi:TonB-dependent receptor [Hymenobacter cellulosivorans]|uniref:TonB-dependent receptor n=1 Tax=Hymenobacter cellulosivorans TaxID=2932249 RepID=A0ABY4FBP5_9BACT|nr:TonB-dependent receptor [Hymenobacter cellulosivorans]UOQ53502.1 TonB-dependent receptor [Hymenobacter cellulosivorans]